MDFGENSQRSERQSSSLSADGVNRDDNDPNRAGSSADDSQSVRSNQPIDFDHQINRSSLNFFDSDDEIEINAELFSAVRNDNQQEVQKLLKAGVNTNIKKNKDNTPLHYAVERNKKEIVGAKNNEDPDPERAKQHNQSQHTNKKTKQNTRIDPMHGNFYQLKLLMLFLFRGVSHLHSFRLGTEIKEAKKFDDLVFEYIEGDKKIYRLLQAKHRLDENKKIMAHNLLTESDDDYSLTKYFFSYKDSKKEKLFIDGSIKDVIIFTNINFDFENLKSAQIRIEKIKGKDDILDVKNDKQSTRYRFNEEVISLLKPKLHDYNLTKLARRLAECFLHNNYIKHHDSKDIFSNYHVKLAEEVIDTTKKLFHDKFIKGSDDLSEDTKKFRKVFKEAIKKKSNEKITLENINEAIRSKKKIIDDKQVGLTLSKNFGKGEDKNWPIDAISNDEMKDFLNHLVFAVNQPNEEELGEIVKDEIGKKYDLGSIATKSVYHDFFDKMSKWFQGKERDKFLTNKQGKKFFEESIGDIYKLVSLTLTKEYRAKIKKFGIEFSDERSWLSNFLSSDEKQIFNLICLHGTILSSIKVYQTLKSIKKDDSYIFVRASSIYNCAIEAFKSIDLLVIECKVAEKNVDELYSQLSNVICSNNKKKIILITQENNLLVSKFKVDFSGDGRYEEKKDEKNSLSDLTYDSQQKLLKEGKVIFQGEEVSLDTLVDDESKDLVDGEVLYDLMEGKEITIGTSLPCISDSNSPAYHKVMEEVDGHNLKNIKGDIFVVSGIDSKSLESKLDIEQGKIVTYKELVFSREIQFQFILLKCENNYKTVDNFEKVCRQYQKSVPIQQSEEQEEKMLIHLIEFKNDIFIWNRYYDPKFYIERDFNKIEIDIRKFQDVLKESSQDIFVFSGVQSDEFKQPCGIIEGKIASTENELSEKKPIFILRWNEEGSYNIICQRHDNVHWIQQDNNKLIWKRSKGNPQIISNLRKEINVTDCDSSHPEIYLVDVIKSERLAVIADVPGMGKSTTLVSLSEEYKKQNQLDWVIKVNLRECENAIDIKLLSSGNINIDTVINFICEINIIGIQKLFARNLLKHKLVSNSGSGVLLLLDGFDEIRGDDQLRSSRQSAVVELLKFLKEKTNTKVLITTRPYERERGELEVELSVLSYDFNLIADDQSEKFISQFWQNNLKLKYSQENLGSFQYQRFAAALLDRSRDIFGENEVSKFIGIPLQLRILSEAYLKGDKGFEENKLKTNGEIQTLLQDLNISNLYKGFVVRKYEIYFDEKNRFNNIVSDSDKEELKKSYQKAHMRLAFKYYFADESQSTQDGDRPFKLFFSESDERTVFETKFPSYAKARELCKIGIIQIQKSSERYQIDFKHRTFAEYFISELIFYKFQKKALSSNYSTELMKKMWNFLLNDIFILENYKVIRNFINSQAFGNLLVNFDVYIFIHKVIVDGLLKARISQLTNEETQLHVAAREGLFKIALFLLENAPKGYIAAKADGRNSLHYAVKSNNIAIIEALLNCVKNQKDYEKIVNAQDISKRTPMSVACSNGNLKVIKLLVENGADVNIAGQKNIRTPALEAALLDRWDIVEYLIENGADINATEEYCGSLLYIFIKRGGDALLDRVKYLVEKGANVNIADQNNGWTPAFVAADVDRWDVVLYLIEKGANMSATAEYYGIIILISIKRGGNDLLNRVKYLVEKGADVNIADQEDGRTPALLAADEDRWDIVEYLIEKGADINTSNEFYGTLLHISIRQGGDELLDRVKYLVEKGADVNIVDQEEGLTPALLAANRDKWDIVEYLIEKGANINAFAIFTGTLLHISIGQGGDDLLDRVKYLVEKGVDVNIADQNNGWTPAFVAAAAADDRWNIVLYLIEKGADINVADKYCETLLHISIRRGGNELLEKVKCLVEKGADVNIAELKNGWTPTLFAANEDRWDVVEYLIEKGANINSASKCWGTLLVISISQGGNDLLDRVKYLVEKGADINNADDQNYIWTPALEAAYRNRWDIVKYLNEKGVNMNATAEHYGILILISIKRGRNDILDRVKYLVDKGADVNIADSIYGLTPALLAAHRGKWDIVEYLIEKGANINAASQVYGTLLHLSIRQRGNALLDRVKYLVEKGADVNIVDPRNGQTPVIWAVRNKRWDIVKYLIEKDADINAAGKFNDTLLYHVCSGPGGDELILNKVKYLVEKGADVNFADPKDGLTPALFAANHKRWDVVEYLIEKGANINAVAKLLGSLLHISTRQDRYEQLDRAKYLLEKGAHYNVKDTKCKTPLDLTICKWDVKNLLSCIDQLFHAAQGGEKDVDSLFKGKDSNTLKVIINARNSESNTPLHCAAQLGNIRIVRLLLKKGADPNIRNESGRTPLDLAKNKITQSSVNDNYQQMVDLFNRRTH